MCHILDLKEINQFTISLLGVALRNLYLYLNSKYTDKEGQSGLLDLVFDELSFRIGHPSVLPNYCI